MAPKKRTQTDFSQPAISKRLRTRANNQKTRSAGDVDNSHDTGGTHNVAPSELPVWASTRQSLCDAVPYFKSHQGGVYTKDCFPHGILFARNGEVGDAVMMNKCIYSLGGGREMKEDGTWGRAGTYEPSHFEQWKITRDTQLPVMVLMDYRHPDFKNNIDIASSPNKSGSKPVYVVLGAYFVTEMWQEAVETKDGSEYPIFKIMLQRIDPHEKLSCWKGAIQTHQDNNTTEFFPQYTCNKCSEESPRAFKDQSSLCLNRECKDFFSTRGVRLQRHGLKYRKEFLNWVKPFTAERDTLPDVVPPPPGKDTEGYGTELRCRTGLVCPSCHHCDSRVFYNHWKCSSCGFVHMAEPDPYPIVGIEKETQEHTKKLLNGKNSQLFKEDGTTIFMADPKGSDLTQKSSSKKTFAKPQAEKGGIPGKKTNDRQPDAKGFVTKFSTKNERSTRTTYMVFNPNGDFIGSLVHERPSTSLKESLCGANELWDEIQKPGVTKDFRRNAARCSGSSIETLTRHFTQNFGAHYDFGVKVDDTSFEEAPDVILKSLVHLSHMGKQAVGSTLKVFHQENYKAVLGSTILEPWKQPNELLALAYMEKDTISYHDDGEDQLTGVISTLSLGSPASMKLRFKSTKADKSKGTKGNKAYLVLDVQLQHGDVVTMCDTRLQAFTEHTIVPVGIRRFAMTSRVIREDYYLEEKAAKKLEKLKITLDEMRKSARIPAKAAALVFEGTKLEIEESS
ncbi:hypothetical protein N0V93_009527 [Gnomoniopsis smithogilvyi]|uniref:Alpha-ketoglutarate-dependent dioxygenase AlkB-like domain-containing protein n=1 Tax=Gnomoniopsis smithogilvyi TaxID=1191159 RepID=A0A9W8YJS6_9PEZI|nr:hypothetical protein N0V93_009527 [Gnomoniopsis smithogilvyi]